MGKYIIKRNLKFQGKIRQPGEKVEMDDSQASHFVTSGVLEVPGKQEQKAEDNPQEETTEQQEETTEKNPGQEDETQEKNQDEEKKSENETSGESEETSEEDPAADL